MPAPRPMLNLAVSPYHLSTREPVAAIALTLCDHAVTALPEPAEGRSREHIRAAVDRLPRFLRVLESWRWSGPLWRAGVVGAGQLAPPERAFAGVAAAGRDVFDDEAFARLSAATAAAPPRKRTSDGESSDADDRWLDALCADLLRGGPDPRLSTAVTAALDRFAAGHGYIAVRGPTDSLAQRAETRLARRVFSIALPVMSRAAGGRILDLRNTLADPLASLRSAMLDGFETGGEPGAREALAAAAEDYSRAFETWFGKAARDDENDQRTMREFVSITGAVLPTDAAILSARAALRGVVRASGRAARSETSQDDSPASMSPLRVMLIRPMNVRPV